MATKKVRQLILFSSSFVVVGVGSGIPEMKKKSVFGINIPDPQHCRHHKDNI